MDTDETRMKLQSKSFWVIGLNQGKTIFSKFLRFSLCLLRETASGAKYRIAIFTSYIKKSFYLYTGLFQNRS